MANLEFLTAQFIKSKITKTNRYGKILDIGCGDGSFITSYMQPKELIGIDTNISMETSFLKNLETNDTNGYFNQSLDQIVDSEKQTFDLATAVGVFELNNAHDIRNLLKVTYEMLSANGLFMSIYYPWSNFSPFYAPLIFKGGRTKYEKNTGLTVYSHKLQDIEKLVINAGLNIIEKGCINPYPSLFWRSQNLHEVGFHLETKRDFFCYGGRYIIARK